MRNSTCLLLAGLLFASPLLAMERSTVKAWPLVYHAVDEEAGTERLEIAWPLVDLRTMPRYDSWSLLHLLSRQHNTTTGEHRTSALFDLLGWVSGDETRWRTWVCPLLWLGRANASSHAVLFPLYWRFVNGHRRTNAVFPLYLGSRSGQSNLQGYLFLVWRGERDYKGGSDQYHRESLNVFPFYWSSKREKNGDLVRDHQTLLPLFSRHEKHVRHPDVDRDEWHKSALFLVRWKTKDETNRARKREEHRHRWMVWPLVQHRRHTVDFTDTGIHRETVETRVLSPIAKTVSRTSAKADGTKLHASYEQRVFPFYFRGGRDYGEEGTYVVFFPFWWDLRKPDKHVQALVPLGARLQDGEDRALNILGPLFTRLRSEKQDYTRYDLLFPFFMVKTGEHTAAFRLWPAYAQHREDGQREGGSICWPLVRWEERSDAKGARTYTPVFGDFANLLGGSSSPTPSGSLKRSVWPFFVSKRSGDGWSWWSFPVGGANHHSSPNTERDAFHVGPFGLLYRHKIVTDADDDRPRTQSDLLSGLWSGEQGDNVSTRRIGWLYGKEWRRWYNPRQERVTERTEVSFLPFVQREARRERDSGRSQIVEETHTTTVPFLLRTQSETERDLDGAHHGSALDVLPLPLTDAGLYHQRTRTDGSSELAILDPLWTVQTSAKEEQEATSLGGIAYKSERDVCGFRERRLFYRVFRTEANSRRRTWELMPFADGMASTRGARSFQLLGGLFGYETGPERTRIRLAYLPLFSKRHAKPTLSQKALQARAKQHLAYGLKYLASRTPERAFVELSLAEPAFGKDPALYEKLGDAFALVCDRGFSGDFLQKAVQDIRSFSSDYPRSFQYEMAGRDQPQGVFRARAVAAYKKAQELGGDSALLRRKLIQLAPPTEKEALYTSALSAFPKDFSLRCDHANSLPNMGSPHDQREKQHLAALRELAAAYPESSLVQYQLLNHTTWATGGLPQAVDQAMAAVRLADRPTYQRLYPSRQRPPENNSRRCLDFALAKMQDLADHFQREKDYAKALVWWQRRFETRLDWGITPDSEQQRRQHVSRLRYLREQLKTEDELIPYLERAVADLKPEVEREAWQREIGRLKREASYLTTWSVEGPMYIGGKGVQASSIASPPRLLAGRLFDRYVNLREALPVRNDSLAKCRVEISSQRDLEAVILLGFDERIEVSLNGTEVFSGKSRIAVADEFRIPVRLRKGRNQLSLSLANRKLAWGFFLRLATPGGNPIEGLTVRAGAK
jgi:hypothetical protein